MGLGLLGRGVGDVKFLAEGGADLIVTDLKTEDELAPSLKKLKTKSEKRKAIKFILGGHRLQDFRNRDFILKAAGVPLNSPFIAEARKNNIPIEMSTALTVSLLPVSPTGGPPGVTVIGVTGTRGKSTTTQLIYETLKLAKKRVWLGGNVKGVSTLALLPKIRRGDYLVLELDSWQLQGFGEAKISPQIAVFTNFMSDHLNYYKGDTQRYFEDKANIYHYQTKSDYLVVGPKVKVQKAEVKSTIQKSKVMPANWQPKLPGQHNLDNIGCAIAVAEILKIDGKIIKKAVENFTGVPGRLELIRSVRGIKIYNDTTATTPDALLAALRALGVEKKIILIAGGADKGLDLSQWLEAIPRFCQKVILLPGSGTDRLKRKAQSAKVKITAQNLKEAVEVAMSGAKRGDVILFSPGFASFGLFKNEYDRGEQFNRLVKKL